MNHRFFKYFLILPGTLAIFIVAAGPVIKMIQVSFMEWKLSRSPFPQPLWSLELDGWGGIGYLFDNFTRSFSDDLTLNAIQVTATFTFFSVALTLLISMGLALILVKGGFLRSFVRSILLLPFAMSPALVGVSWRFLFSPDFGLFHAFFGVLSPELSTVDFLGDPLYAMIILIACDVWHWSPYVTLLLIGGLASVPGEAREAAFVDGANSFQVFKDITLPLMLPIIGVAVILKSIFSLKMFDQVYMLTNGGPSNATQTLGHYIYMQGFKYFDMGYASALSYWLILPMGVLAVLYIRLIFSGKTV